MLSKCQLDGNHGDGTEIVPKSGMIIVYDGQVVHEVLPTNAHRTCVAMNFSILVGD